jgi:hypothetical protein
MLRMPGLIRDLLADRSANAVVVTAFSILSLIGGAGLATDTIQWTLAKRQLQRMTDSAALAGAFSLAKGGNARSSATTELGRYNLLTLNGSPVIETPPGSGSYASNTKAVRVTINAQKPLPFSSMFMRGTPTMQATATAAAVGFGTYCVVSLESTTATGITFQGSASVNLGCGATTNSQGTTAVYAGGGSTITASPISAVGVVPPSSNYTSGTVLNSYSLAQPDPYSSIGLPTGYSCSNELIGQFQERHEHPEQRQRHQVLQGHGPEDHGQLRSWHLCDRRKYRQRPEHQCRRSRQLHRLHVHPDHDRHRHVHDCHGQVQWQRDVERFGAGNRHLCRDHALPGSPRASRCDQLYHRRQHFLHAGGDLLPVANGPVHRQLDDEHQVHPDRCPHRHLHRQQHHPE